MYEMKDPVSGISVMLEWSVISDRIIYRFSTDAWPREVPEEIVGKYRGYTQLNGLAVAADLLRMYNELRPYESSKSLLM